jgi:hypothetical protein
MLFPTNFWASNIEVDLYAGESKIVTPFLSNRYIIQDSYATSPVIWTIVSGQIYSPIDNHPLITLENANTANPTIVFDEEFSPLVEYSFTLRMTSVLRPSVYSEVEIITRYESFSSHQTPLNFVSQNSYPTNYYVDNAVIEPYIEIPITTETCLKYVIQYPKRDGTIVTVEESSPLVYHITDNILRIYTLSDIKLILETTDYIDISNFPICNNALEVLVGNNSRTYVQTNLGVKREAINSLYRVSIYNLTTDVTLEYFEDANGYLPVTITCTEPYSPFIEQYIYVPIEECGECSSMYIEPNNTGVYINSDLNTLLPNDSIFGDITRIQDTSNVIFKDRSNKELIKYQGIFNTVKLNNVLVTPKAYSLPAINNSLFKEVVGISPTVLEIPAQIKQAITEAIISNTSNTGNIIVNTGCYTSTRDNALGCEILNSSTNCYDFNTTQVGFTAPNISWLCPIATTASYSFSIGTLGSSVILIESNEIKILKFNSVLLTPITNYLVTEGIANTIIPAGSTWAGLTTPDKTLLVNSFLFKPVSSVVKTLPCTYTINYTDSTNQVITNTDPVCPASVVVLPQVLLDALSIETLDINNLTIGQPFHVTGSTIYSSNTPNSSFTAIYSYPQITYDTGYIYQNRYPIYTIQPADILVPTCYIQRFNYINHSFMDIEVDCSTTLNSINYKYLRFNKEYAVTNTTSFSLSTLANLLTNIPINQIEWNIVEGLGSISYPNITMSSSKIVLQAKYSDYIVSGLTICYEIPI